MFTEQMLGKGFHNPFGPPLLEADDIEYTAFSIVACWTVFTELLPGNPLAKSVAISTVTAGILCLVWKINTDTTNVSALRGAVRFALFLRNQEIVVSGGGVRIWVSTKACV